MANEVKGKPVKELTKEELEKVNGGYEVVWVVCNDCKFDFYPIDPSSVWHDGAKCPHCGSENIHVMIITK